MNTDTTATDWRRSQAWGWPAGSVRALLALLIFGTTWTLLVLRPAQEIPVYLRDLLFIILGHYFAARRRAEPTEEAGPPPLYLPRGSVRLILIAGCGAVGAVLYARGQLTAPQRHPGVLTLLLLGGFLLGVAASGLLAWLRGDRPPSRLVEDLRAFVSVAAALLLIALVLNGAFGLVPADRIAAWFRDRLPLGNFGPETVLAAVVGFYFGSRS
jgi:hypothetical protein